jgi:ATP-dependent helicase/nuclease subunit A
MNEHELQRQDAHNRLEALELRSFIVEAPAGAGKTELLTQRYLKLLSVVSAPEEIIALTFTNKATAEMRQRILQSLQDAADGVPIDKPHKQQTRELALAALRCDAQHDWGLLQQPSRLRIQTIDALCSSLTQQMPLLSRFGGQPMLIDDASLHYAEAAQNAIADIVKETDANGPISMVLAFLDNQTEKLTALLANMLARRDQWLPLLVGEHTNATEIAAQTEQILAELISAALQATIDAVPSQVQLMLMPTLRYAAAHLPDDDALKTLQDWATPLDTQPATLKHWRLLSDFLLTKSGTFRIRLTKDEGFPPDKTGETERHKANFAAACAQIGDTSALRTLNDLPLVDTNDIARNTALVAAFGETLKLAAGHLWGVFQARNEVDFIEISQSAITALSGATDLALRLDYQIAHLLVDEFQDTSPTQIQLLTLLTQGWEARDGRTLFCVGDPMQSIYRFRKADVKEFLHASVHGIGAIALKPLKLSLNNRSHPEVIRWVNDSFARIFPVNDIPQAAAIRYRPATPQKPPHEEAGVAVHPLVISSDEESATAKHHEARHIAQLITHEQAQFPQQEIAVLARSRTHLRALVSVMRQEFPQLTFQAVDIEALNERQTVLDALSLTRAMLQLADRVHWLAILRAPWCGLTLADLHTLCADNHHATIWQLLHDEVRFSQLSSDGQLRVRHLMQVLSAAFAEQGRIPLRRWLETTWLRLGGGNTLISAGDVRDVQTFFDLVEKLSQGYFVDFAKLDAQMEKLYAKPDLDGNPKLQLMTMHASKGLEFDCVILPALNTKPRNDDKPLMLWENFDGRLLAAPLSKKNGQATSLYDFLLNMEKTRTTNETARLLYVAATRAKRKLHLVATVKETSKNERKPQSNSLLEQLWPCVEADFTEAEMTRLAETQTGDLADFSSRLLRLPTENIPTLTELPSIANRAANADEPTQTGHDLNKDMGTLAHLYLELIAKGHFDARKLAQAEPAMCLWLRQQGHTTHQIETAASQVISALQRTLQNPQGQWVLKDHSQAKTEFALISADGEKHVIDRTFVENNIRWVIDYKLGLEVTEANAEIVAKQQHAEQLARYAKLFSSEGLPVKQAILFLNMGKLIVLNNGVSS